jgi:peroxiredoxin
MTIKIGERIPDAGLFRFTEQGPTNFTSADLFKSRTVVVFGVPGAFTPVCSEQHLPGFLALADDIKARGVDEIICISVNDVHVMRAWEKQTGVEGRVTMYGDGGSFVKTLGLTVDIPVFGLGIRSQRFSMLIRDGLVEQLNVETTPSEAGVSSAEHILGQL